MMTQPQSIEVHFGHEGNNSLCRKDENMVYNWDLHEPKCYRLYIDEKKPLEEIMDIMRIEDNFTPSKRAYQTQFRRWNFPSKQNPAHKDDRLVARVKELWEKNLTQREMLRILNEEDGFGIKHRELMRVRSRNRWLLRTPNTDRLIAGEATPTSHDGLNSHADLSSPPAGMHCTQSPHPGDIDRVEEDRTIETSTPRKDWPQGPEADPAEQREARKRRRLPRARPGQPVDAPGQPRFPSETTIDESRIILSLDAKLYQEVRAHFASICADEGVSRKTIAGHEKWDDVKNRLTQEVAHLQAVMWTNSEDSDNRRLALDVICTDVTKRMRSMEQKLTIADAKNVLGINPEEYRIIRQDFAQVLRGDHSRSKTEAGPERWEELKEKWQAESVILQGVLQVGEEGPPCSQKLRAVDVVARDVMKRLRDGQSKQHAHAKHAEADRKPVMARAEIEIIVEDDDLGIQPPNSPSHADSREIPVDHEFIPPSPIQYHRVPTPMIVDASNASNAVADHDSLRVRNHEHLQPTRQGMQLHQTLRSTLPDNSALPNSPSHHQTPLLPDNVNSGLPIDPRINGSLPILLNSHDASLEIQHAHSPFPLGQALSPNMAHSPHPFVQNPFVSQPVPRPPVAVYLRLHPSSAITMAPSIWIATLTSRTFEELRHVAVKDFPGAMCVRVEGILGEDMTIEVSRDDELTAYLAVLEGRNSAGMPGPPCFYVQILPGGWKT